MSQSRQNRLPELFENRLLGFLVRIAASDWIAFAVEAWKFLARSLRKGVYPGMYEILDYDSVLELKDTRGRTAVFRRRQKVKFLHDNIVALQEQVWGDGEPLADYECSPGVPVDRYKHGYKHVVLISLRGTKGRGEVLEFNTERKIKDGFTKPDEWFQIELNFKTRRVKLTVIFPKRRHCQRAILVERNRNRSAALDQDHFSLLPDGRQALSGK